MNCGVTWEIPEEVASGFSLSDLVVDVVPRLQRKKKKSPHGSEELLAWSPLAASSSSPHSPLSLLLCVSCTCVNTHLDVDDRL